MEIFVLSMHLKMSVGKFGKRIAKEEWFFIFIFFESCFEIVRKIILMFFITIFVAPFDLDNWPSSLGAI